MSPHYCKEEKSHMMISGCCNWCGERELDQVIVVNDTLVWVTWAFVILVVTSWVILISFLIAKYL